MTSQCTRYERDTEIFTEDAQCIDFRSGLKPLGGFSSDTEVANGATHEHCKAITTRSGKKLSKIKKDKHEEDIVDNTDASTVLDKSAPIVTVPATTDTDQTIPQEVDEADSKATIAPRTRFPNLDKLEETMSPPPFPQRLKKKKLEYQFKSSWTS
ncbi:hypothetical protein V6N11_058288 [Hibiscus sabdariffa]|uniref:Uncharacterized protein n=1 Tax=Hibiscus sabdariffa TaxID=183260 RepID=A0ABR2U452_9ROSI